MPSKFSKKKLKKYLAGQFTEKTLRFTLNSTNYSIKYKPEISNVDSSDIMHKIGISPYQLKYFNVVALKDPATGERFIFGPKGDLDWCRVLDPEVELNEETVYILEVADDRELEWEVLSPELKEQVKKEFYAMDTDKSDSISVEEAKEYFKNLEKKNLEDAEIYFTELLEQATDDLIRQDINNRLEKYRENYNNLVGNQIDVFFHSADINHDGKVSLHEWCLVKANQIVTSDRNYEKRIEELLVRQEEKRKKQSS